MANAFQDNAFQDNAFQEPGGGGTEASAGVATGTGAAFGASISIAVNAGLASGTGVANNATVSVTGTTAIVTEMALEVMALPNTQQAVVTELALEVLRRSNPEGGSQIIIVGM